MSSIHAGGRRSWWPAATDTFMCSSTSSNRIERILTSLQKRSRGTLSFHHACIRPHSDIVDYLVESTDTDIDVNAKHENGAGSTAFHIACKSSEGFIKLIEYTINSSQANIDADAKDGEGMTPLHHAFQRCNLEFMECLISSNHSKLRSRIDLNIQDNQGRTPFHIVYLRSRVKKNGKATGLLFQTDDQLKIDFGICDN
mmetsp:Transcript_15999/g.44272  ORF Transcript_15999/g.44272 Transcript_15999/m.44272 type:complete len:199 (+) Transcript_15999:507-1103(+)